MHEQASSARLGSEERKKNTMCVCSHSFSVESIEASLKKSCKLLLVSILLQRHPLGSQCGYKAFLTKQRTICTLLICFERKESIEHVSSYAIILKKWIYRRHLFTACPGAVRKTGKVKTQKRTATTFIVSHRLRRTRLTTYSKSFRYLHSNSNLMQP